LVHCGQQRFFLYAPILASPNKNQAIKNALNYLVYLGKTKVPVIVVQLREKLLPPSSQLAEKATLYGLKTWKNANFRCFFVKCPGFY